MDLELGLDNMMIMSTEWVKLHDVEGAQILCGHVHGNKVDRDILRHVYCHGLPGDGHLDLEHTWRARVVEVVSLVLVVIIGRQLKRFSCKS